MASRSQFLLLFLVFIIKFSAAESFSINSIAIGVRKDNSTLQYTTQMLIGTHFVPTKLVLHLCGQSLWVSCNSGYLKSSPAAESLQCSAAKSGGQVTRIGVELTCEIHQENPITGVAAFGNLVEDAVAVGDGTDLIPAVDGFLFSCVPENLLHGLAGGAKGMLGLGRSKIALPSQLTNSLGSPQKFSLCLSSSDGVIVAGGNTDISKSFTYTPLLSPEHGKGYYVNVKSIKINGKKLSFGSKNIGGVEISTIVPYSTMKTEIYEVFVKAFVKSAVVSMNMETVAPVAPFGVCFSSEGVSKVPDIDLVLQSQMVKWRVQGRNSMVQVSDAVMCLGFLDGGLEMKSSMVLGGYQLEDHLLEFNLGTSMLGFTSSLLNKGDGCSNIRASVLNGRGSL